MAHYSIVGQQPLHGEITIAGRKNAALKLIAASLLTDQDVTLHRIPDIGDVQIMLTILEMMGARVTRHDQNSYTINTSAVSSPEIPSAIARKLRASLVLVGPLLARFHRVLFPHPGGCVIGKRSIEPHLDAFRQLGASISFDGTFHTIEGVVAGDHMIYLRERSVTGTENLIMASVAGTGTTTIVNAAQEEHIGNLCDLLRSMGYTISGDGTSTIIITGTNGLQHNAATITTLPDEIEIGTFAVASLITQGTVTLKKVGKRFGILPILTKLDEFNAQYTYSEETEELQLLPSPNLQAADIQTNPWPGFFPDLQSPFTVLATQAQGSSLIHDWMYEGRLYFVDHLQRMGASIVVCDPHRVLVTGPTPLEHASVPSPDLRAGAALVLAALVAHDRSTIEHVEIIERGYEALDIRLRALHANIERIND